MSLVGNLEDLGLAEIMQIVSLSRKSGILTLHSQRREGRIAFRQGDVIRATSPLYRSSLGDVLVRKGLVDLPTLRHALSIQEEEGFKERLATILANRFNIPLETIEQVVRERTETIVYSFFNWTEGSFGFELQDNVEFLDSIEMDPMQFTMDQGLSPQFLAMEGTRLIDEKRHRGEDFDEGNELSPETPPPEENVDIAFNLLELPGTHAPSRSAAETEERPVLVVVDDNATTREALVHSLQGSGYDVYPFAGSEGSLLKLGALHLDGRRPLALIDLIMPKMDGTGMLGGVELLELIKNTFPDIPALAMADCHNSEAERKVRQLRFPLIMKPRKNDISDSALLKIFVSRLLSELDQVKSGGGTFESCENVNLGDELRLEMGEEPAPSPAPVVQSAGISLLRGMLEELNNPALGGGIILLVLRFASEFMNRAVIFIVRQEEIVGLGQFGINDNYGSADSIVRNMKIPRGENSLFIRVIEAQTSVKIAPDDGVWTRYLLGKLGDCVPTELFVGPIVSEGKVVALLYGDNLPGDKPIGDTEALEIFLSQAGLAMEKAILERKLKGRSMEGM
jgi:CheY-like chemotaxis protein